MFLKRLERREGRKKHTYGALVESYRTDIGSRHRVVAYLGELSKRDKSEWGQTGDSAARSELQMSARPPGDRHIHSTMNQSSSRPGPNSEFPPSEVLTA